MIMTLSSPDWQYQRRNGSRPVVLLPGWATDARVFAGLDIPSDVIRPTYPLTGDIDSLAEFLRERESAPALLLGWSLGGFAAVRFARRYPALVERVVLVGIRGRYPAGQLDEKRQTVRRDRLCCLTDFYRQCFLPAQRADYRRFRVELEPAYLSRFTAVELEAGLDYLERIALEPDDLPPGTIIVHGAKDIIAPPAEACRLARDAGAVLHLLPRAGHAAFLAEDFLSICSIR